MKYLLKEGIRINKGLGIQRKVIHNYSGYSSQGPYGATVSSMNEN